MTTYTTKEVAEILEVTDRTVRRYLNEYYTNKNGTIEISEKMLSILKFEHLGQSPDSPRTPLGQGEDIKNTNELEIVETFTQEEYSEFQKRLIEYPLILKQLEYHIRSSESHQRQMELILKNLQQRNFIEANDKGINE